jgi:hypothetical protein
MWTNVLSQHLKIFKYHPTGRLAFIAHSDISIVFFTGSGRSTNKSLRVICNYTLSGCLLNALVEELIIRVTTVEDIPATTAVHLVTVFGVVIDRAPRVFEVKKKAYLWGGGWDRLLVPAWLLENVAHLFITGRIRKRRASPFIIAVPSMPFLPQSL